MAIGERIQLYRKRKGMSQEELGQRLHLSRQTVSLWENGQTLPTIDNLIRLKEIFGVTIDDMVDHPEKALEEYTAFFEKKDIDGVWKKRRRAHLCSFLPSLLWWVFAIAVFVWFDAHHIFIGFLAGAFFADTLFCMKLLFGKIKEEKSELYSACDKTAKLEIHKTFVTASLYRENELLWSITFTPNDSSFEEVFDGLIALRECGKAFFIYKSDVLESEFFKGYIK